MDVLQVVKLLLEHLLAIKGSYCGETLEGGGELAEDRRLGDSFQSLDVPRRGHVKATEDNEDSCQGEDRKQGPGSN